MSFHHVVAQLVSESKPRVLFTDLSESELKKRFVKPYQKGLGFFSSNDVISPYDLRSLHIIRTDRCNSTERDELNRNDLEKINGINRSGDGLYFRAAGGYAPLDIIKVGADLTHEFIKHPPGFKTATWKLSAKALGWTGTIISGVLVAGAAKLLGWV